MINDVVLEGIVVKTWKYADDLLRSPKRLPHFVKVTDLSTKTVCLNGFYVFN